jgi:hypothetical protein
LKKQGKPVTEQTLNPPTKPTHPEESKQDIPIEKLLDYRKRKLTYEEIATLTGLCRQTVSIRIKEADLDGLDVFSAQKDNVFEHKQQELVKNLTGEKIKGMSGLQIITGAAIFQDKIQAIRGQATEIIEHRSLVFDLNKAYEQLRASGNHGLVEVHDIEVINSLPECPQK